MNCKVKIFLLFVLQICLLSGCAKDTSGILATFDSYRGYSRTVSEEEFELYQYLVERDLPEEISEGELNELTKAYAAKVNAAFYLGNKLGICEPYSYEALKLRMEQENASREVKKQEGEAIYGLDQFTLYTYFQYTLDDLQTTLIRYIEDHADEEILELSKEYYKTHKELFQYRDKIVYEQTVDNVTEILTADSELLNDLGKADAGLADFLAMAQIGEVYQDEKNGQKRTVILKEITYSADDYEENAQLVLYHYVRNELYDQILTKVAENNPLVFE